MPLQARHGQGAADGHGLGEWPGAVAHKAHGLAPAIDDNAAGVAARYGRVDLQHVRRANQAADLAVTADDARAHGEVQALRGADRGDGLALAWQGGGHAHRLARLAVDQQRGHVAHMVDARWDRFGLEITILENATNEVAAELDDLLGSNKFQLRSE